MHGLLDLEIRRYRPKKKNQDTINLGPAFHDDYLKFPNGDKVTDKTVENFCKRFVEKIFADYITRI